MCSYILASSNLSLKHQRKPTLPDDVRQTLEEQTRPEEEYLTWFNRQNYKRLFAAAEFHDETLELP